MKVSHFIRAASLIVLSAACVQANSVVQTIELAGTDGVGINITSPTFYQPGQPESAFGLPTFGFKEELVDGRWWDVLIKVTTPASPTAPVMIAIDKEVCNHTTLNWTDFHITVGTGSGNPGFNESHESDGLFFITVPEPLETLDRFADPPMLDEPDSPDNLWWFSDATHPGIVVDGKGRFIFGITIPSSMFVTDPTGGPAMATITLRQHASIPEPSSFALLVGMCALGASRWTRRRDVA